MHVHPLPMVTFKESIKLAFIKFCSFNGRSRRSEFWHYYLFTQLVLFIPAIVFIMSIFNLLLEIIRNGINPHDVVDNFDKLWPLIVIGILLLINIILLIPLISLSVRRLHDTGKSGCYLLLCLIPFGFFIIFIFLVEDSHQNMNEYGPSPKYVMMQTAPLLYNSQVISVVGTPYINQQIAPGYPIQNSYPYQQNQQIQQ